MDLVSRLIAACVVLAGLFIGSAHAANTRYETGPQIAYGPVGGGVSYAAVPLTRHTSAQAACEAAGQSLPTPPSPYGAWQLRAVQNNAGGALCIWRSYSPTDSACDASCWGATHSVTVVYVDDVTCTGGQVIGDSASKWYWKGKGSTTCQQGCLYIADQFAYDKESGYSVGWGRLNGLGATCTTGQESAGDNPPDNKPPNKCDPGKCTGTINGVAVCVKCGNGGSVDQKSETTTKDPDGEGGEPGETTSTKTDTKTTCDDGKCQTTTTTTTTNGDGTTKTETKTEDQSQDEFCAKNPDHALCKEEESKFEGGCQSGFRCEGDAVQCAMAREQHQRMCQLLDTETDLSTLGKRVGSGEDAADVRAQLGTGVAPVDVSGQLASATPLGPNSGCPADVSVGNWTIPFSRMCPHLNTLGNALIGLSWLVAALIVFRRAD